MARGGGWWAVLRLAGEVAAGWQGCEAAQHGSVHERTFEARVGKAILTQQNHSTLWDTHLAMQQVIFQQQLPYWQPSGSAGLDTTAAQASARQITHIMH